MFYMVRGQEALYEIPFENLESEMLMIKGVNWVKAGYKVVTEINDRNYEVLHKSGAHALIAPINPTWESHAIPVKFCRKSFDIAAEPVWSRDADIFQPRAAA